MLVVLVVVGVAVVDVVAGASVELVDVVGAAVDDVLVVDSQVQAAEHTSPGAHRKTPPGELRSQGSLGSTTPLPQRSGAVVLVVGVVVEVVVVDSQVHAAEHTSPGAHRKTPPGELRSQGSLGSTTPLPQRSGAVVLVVGVVVEVVEVDSQVHAAEHTSPGAHRKTPPGELRSQGSLGSTTPLPQRFLPLRARPSGCTRPSCAPVGEESGAAHRTDAPREGARRRTTTHWVWPESRVVRDRVVLMADLPLAQMDLGTLVDEWLDWNQAAELLGVSVPASAP